MSSWQEIKKIAIVVNPPGIYGWVIDMKINQRNCTFVVAPRKDDEYLEDVFKAIKLQVGGRPDRKSK